jgi:nucleoside-diphosphate-sugar epimerase/uncharacterized membrane protein
MRSPNSLPNIIVTGSSGLIGSAFIDRASNRYREFGFDRKGPPHPPPATEHLIDCDLTSDESVRAALAQVRERDGVRIASVIHLAAYYDFSGEPSPLYEELTVRGTERLLRGLREFEVEQFIFSSTMLVHAPCKPGERIDENWPLEPKWDYPKSKVQTEQLILAEHGTMPVVLLRIAGVYDDDCHSIPIANQIARIYERRMISHVYPGDTARGQAFIHLDDLTAALERIIERRAKLPPETVLLLGEPETLSYEELQRIIGWFLHGEEWETRQIPKALAKTGAWLEDAVPGEEPFIKPWMIDLADDHYALDITRARSLLGWGPRRSLRATLPEMIKRLKRDPKAWFEKNELPVPAEALYANAPDPDVAPEPWHYNPSSWRQRARVAIWATLAMLIAIYMGLYQWRLIPSAWDPVFGEQTQRVLDSDVSHTMSSWFRIPDSVLGAFAYLGDVVFALAGSTRRWQDRPWLVVLFGIDVIPLGVVSAVLVVLQGTVVGSWCFLCLITAAISLILIIYAYDEVWSSLLYLWRVWKKSRDLALLWRTFWGKPSSIAQEVGENMSELRKNHVAARR